MPQDDITPGTPPHWLARADGHLALARHPKPTGAFWEDLASHAQQATEPSYNAVHQHHGIVLRFTHNLEEVVMGLKRANVPVPKTVETAVSMETGAR